MTKNDIVQNIFHQTDLSRQDVQKTVQALLDEISHVLSEGGRLEFRDFGVFEVQEVKARVGRNPQDPEIAIGIPARAVVKFKAGKKMRRTVMEANPIES